MQKSPFFIGIPTEASLDRLAESLGLGDLVNEYREMIAEGSRNKKETRVDKQIESVMADISRLDIDPTFITVIKMHAHEIFKRTFASLSVTQAGTALRVAIGRSLDQSEATRAQDLRSKDSRMSCRWIDEGAVFYITDTEKETNMNKEQNEEKMNEQKEEPVMKPEKKRSPTPGALIWDKLNRAGLSNEAVLFIVKVLYGTLGLKTPTDERQVMIIERKDSFEIIYSHNDSVVVRCPGSDFSATLADGTVVDGNSGIESAYYVVGKKKELTEDGLLKKHVGSFKLTLSTPKGHAELPYNHSIEDRGEEGIKLTLLCNLEFYFKDGEFHNLEGPAYTAFDGRKNYIINGKPVSEEGFKQLTNRRS